MLSYLMIGASDVAVSAHFYAAVLAPFGYEHIAHENYSVFALKDIADKDNGPGTICIQKPFDGGAATPGNGMMPAFRAKTRQDVDAFHAAGLSHGGSDEGAPGTRSAYGENFYVAYLRDPVGNKLAAFCAPEPER